MDGAVVSRTKFVVVKLVKRNFFEVLKLNDFGKLKVILI